ncbi:hypothetical protein [Roseateles chitinivorans]|uniref:hypothetical protein n=1 Tax=Roseateles chitinivorans TaxID=2917965 RepID=UPI003D66A626
MTVIAQTEAPRSVTSGSGSSTTPTTDERDTADWSTLLLSGLQQGWSQMTGLLWPAASSEPRVFDLGELAPDSEVRSRNFGGEILLEVVSGDNQLLDRRSVERDSVDLVRVNFGCSETRFDLPSDQFDEGHLTYVNAANDAMGCGVLALGYPVPPESLFFPQRPPQSQAVV